MSYDSHLGGIIDPRESLVAGDHCKKIGEAGARIERGLCRIFPLLQHSVAHDQGVKVIDCTLEGDQRHDACEPLLSLSLSIFPTRYLLLKNPIVEVADKYSNPTNGKLALTP